MTRKRSRPVLRGRGDGNIALLPDFFERAFKTLSESLHSKGVGVPALNPIAWQQFAVWQERRGGSALPSFSLAYYGSPEVATPQSLGSSPTQGGRKKPLGF